MNLRRLNVAGIICVMALSLAAQTPRRGATGRSPVPKPTPAARPSPTTTGAAAQPTPTQPADPTSMVLAVVNDASITTADIQESVDRAVLNDPDVYFRAFYQDREKAIKEARQRAVDVRINSLLAAAEAKKRGLTMEDFLDRQINSKIGTPSEAEIKATFDANRDQLGTADLESARPALINYLREQRKEQLYAELVTRLKMTNSVIKNADVNAPNLAPGVVLAAVNGQPIRVETINERMKPYVYKQELKIYAAQK